MLQRAAKEIADNFRLPTDLGMPVFRPREHYETSPLLRENYHSITETTGSIAFLDGGNLEVLSSPNYSVHFIRLYFSIFDDGIKRQKTKIPNRIEFFVAVESVFEKEVLFKTRLFPLHEEHKNFLPDPKDLVFSSIDETLQIGKERVNVSTIGGVSRSFAEWNLASHLLKEEKIDLFVRDGTLHPAYTNEDTYAIKAQEAAIDSNTIFAGVAKTCRLFTTTGYSLIAAVSKLARNSNINDSWYFDNFVVSNNPSHKADINIAKLHDSAKFILRVELLKDQAQEKERAFALLASNSRDLSFPGYPYGLVDADKHAGVSQEELEPLKYLLLSEFAKNNKLQDMQDGSMAVTAHDWLDRIV